MRLLDVSSRHLFHHEIAVNFDVFGQDASPDPPFACNGEDSHRRPGVHQAVYAIGDIGKSEPVGCLSAGLPISDVVGRLCPPIARLELVGDEGWTKGPQHQIVVMQGS